MMTVTEMRLGEMFDRVFRLLGKTFLRNAAIGLLVFVPAGILLGFAIRQMAAGIGDLFADILAQGPHYIPSGFDVLSAILPSVGLLSLAILLFAAGSVLAQIAMINVSAAEFTGQSIEWVEALRLASGVRWLRALGAVVLMGLALIGIYIVNVGFIIAGAKTALIFLAILLFPATICVIVYLVVLWIFVTPVIAWEDETMLGAFSRSAALVRGSWWRTFGIFLLFSLIFQFAISILVTPISFISMWGFWSKYFTLIGQSAGAHGTVPDPSVIRDLISSVGYGYGIMLGVTSILSGIAQSVYLVVLYFDARARLGEFARPEGDEPGSELPEADTLPVT